MQLKLTNELILLQNNQLVSKTKLLCNHSNEVRGTITALEHDAKGQTQDSNVKISTYLLMYKLFEVFVGT